MPFAHRLLIGRIARFLAHFHCRCGCTLPLLNSLPELFLCTIMTHVSHQLASIRVLGYLVLLLLLSTTSASPSWEAKPRLPKCKSSKSSNGFHHPGIYHDCRSLDRIQHNYQSGKWAYTEALNLVVARTPSLQKNESWEMQGPFYEVNWAGGDGHN